MVALAGWIVPGGGFFFLKETKRALIILFTISITFIIGLYIGSVAVVDPRAKLWFVIQVFASPLVFYIGNITAFGRYEVFGRPADIGQIYTIIAGMLNLLCIINSAYIAYNRASPDMKECVRGTSG
jgi:hypothetical protein